MVKHSAIWEQRWFQVIVSRRSFPGEWPEVRSDEPDQTFELADEETPQTVIADYRDQIAAAIKILEGFDLDAPCALSAMADRNLWRAIAMTGSPP